MPYQASAEKAYRQLFGSALSLETGGKKEFALQANLLDFLKDDANRLANFLWGHSPKLISPIPESLVYVPIIIMVGLHCG